MTCCEVESIVLENLVNVNKENFDPLTSAYTPIFPNHKKKLAREALKDITKKFMPTQK
jgi:hypothetical protein